MMIHRIQYDLWNLRTRRIVEKDEFRRASQCGKNSANGGNGKNRIGCGRNFWVENILGFGLQTSLLVIWEKSALSLAK
jgi:hypothetical protein